MLGHVDSGKTSLAKILSSVSSTAAFDKNPQSKERGITLDLGFSSFQVEADIGQVKESFDKIQYTLVDCPGHASLIRTIIGGAQIIDLMILVVDVTKGIQTQTAECLIIGEIICPKILVVLNKIDLLPEAKRQLSIEKMSRKILKTLEGTKFKESAKVVAVAANPGGDESSDKHLGIDNLIKVLKEQTYCPQRSSDGPFVFSVDHCFSIRGQGTVMTGTVLSGCVSVNDNIEIANLQMTRKVKSMQMFRRAVTGLVQGDRGALCVTQFDPKSLERGVACSPPQSMQFYCACVVRLAKIRYFPGAVRSKSKLHVTAGHSTVTCKLTLFTSSHAVDGDKLDLDEEYRYSEELGIEGESYALLEFDKPMLMMEKSLMIGSKLDADVNTTKCRLAFKAQMLLGIKEKDYHTTILPRLKVYKTKVREGIVERMHDDYTVICRNLMKKETNMEVFANLKAELSTGEHGLIEGSFGQSGKTKVRIPNGLSEATRQVLAARKKKGKICSASSANQSLETIKVVINFKRFIFDPTKSIKQT